MHREVLNTGCELNPVVGVSSGDVVDEMNLPKYHSVNFVGSFFGGGKEKRGVKQKSISEVFGVCNM